MYVDLHTHTIYSDGKLTPTELVKKAKKLGIFYIALTDHDTLGGMEEFLEAGKKFKVNTFPGIEISSRFNEKSLHIAGLNIDYKNKKLIAYTKKCKQARRDRCLKMVNKLKNNGWKIKKSELKHNVLTRPHVALSVIKNPVNRNRLLEEFKSIPYFHYFINKYLIEGKIAFVPKSFSVTAKQAIDLIHQAQGLAIIAHPQPTNRQARFTLRELNKIAKLDVDGIETYFRDHSAKEIAALKKLALKHNWLISASSDYHGHDDKEYPLGICNNGKYVGANQCWELIEKLLSKK